MNLNRYMLPGEQILWQDRPNQGIVFRPMDAFLIPFSLLWGGFAIFWNAAVWMAPISGDGWFFKLWGLPFLIVGIYMIFGRFFHDTFIRRTTLYAVTNQRIIIMREKRKDASLKSFDIRRLPALELSQSGNDGKGSISFQESSLMGSFFRSNGLDMWVPSLAKDRFDNIDRVSETYQLIERIARSPV